MMIGVDMKSKNYNLWYPLKSFVILKRWWEIDFGKKRSCNNQRILLTNGVYYVCFELLSFTPTINESSMSPTIKVTSSTNTWLTFNRNFTTTQKNAYTCDITSNTSNCSFKTIHFYMFHSTSNRYQIRIVHTKY
jgi:hypothetical protein